MRPAMGEMSQCGLVAADLGLAKGVVVRDMSGRLMEEPTYFLVVQDPILSGAGVLKAVRRWSISGVALALARFTQTHVRMVSRSTRFLALIAAALPHR